MSGRASLSEGSSRERTRPNRLVVLGLLAVALGVWGAVGYRVWTGTRPLDEDLVVRGPVKIAASERLDTRYEADFSDPFAPAAVARSSRTETVTARPTDDDEPPPRGMSDLDALRQFPGGSEREAEPPPPREPEVVWRLRGVVGDAAILESDDGMTRLARVGDYLGDDEVVEIRSDGIRLRTPTGTYDVVLR